MNAEISRRQLIAQRSSIQRQIDHRPRCQDCGSVLVRNDFLSYWVEQITNDWADRQITPRCCEDCAEGLEFEA